MSDRAVAGGELRPSGLHRGEALAQPTEFASPLAEIEARVQRRAKSMALDLDVGGSEQALRDLIADELAAWSVECRRGLRSQDISDPSQVAQRAFVNLAKYGPLSVLLEDPDVWEIMVNAPDAIFVKRHSGQSGFHHEVFHDDDHVIRTLTRLLDDATGSHRTLEPLLGLQDAQLPDGSRLHIVHRDLARGGHLMVNIRKFTGVAFSSLDELVEHGMLGVEAARFLRAVVSARLSMVVSGAPGSGKTTLLNCAAGHLDPSLRVVVAEEVFETDVPLANVASMQTRGGRGEREEVTLRQLVAGFLRMAPDVAIVGEVRDDEALPLLELQALHLVVRLLVEGLHHDPRRVGSSGAHPAALRQPIGRRRAQPAVVGAQHVGQRGGRRRRSNRAHRRWAPGHRDPGRRGPGRRSRRRPVHRDAGFRTGQTRRPVGLERSRAGPRQDRSGSQWHRLG